MEERPDPKNFKVMAFGKQLWYPIICEYDSDPSNHDKCGEWATIEIELPNGKRGFRCDAHARLK